MRFRIGHYFALLSMVFVCLVKATEPKESGAKTEDINVLMARECLKNREGYLNGCKENEIRCVCFLDQNVKMAMVMTLDLNKATTFTVRDVFDWALQNQKNPRLSRTQTETLKKVLTNLPASTPNVAFPDGLHVAFWRNGSIQKRVYSPVALPSEIQRLYDIGGDALPSGSKK